MIDAVLAFGWLFFLDKEVKCSDPYTHECLGASDAALVSFLFCHLATCISRFAAANRQLLIVYTNSIHG